MNNKLYLIAWRYQPNNAPINRLLALTKGLGENGANIELYFLLPDKNHSKLLDTYQNTKIIYLWEGQKGGLSHLLLYGIKKLHRIIEKDSSVIVFSPKLIIPFRYFFHVKLYHERTENPNIVRTFNNNLLEYIYRRTLRKIDGLFVITPSLKTFFNTEIHVPIEKITVVNMVVDSHRFDNINAESKNYITYCGKVSLYKDGVDILIKAFSKIKSNKQLKLRLIGPFENKETEKKLIKLTSDLGIKDQIIFEGPVQAEKMPLLLSEAKLLVLSRPNNLQAKYGFPTKLGEYLSTARPVLVTNVGDFKYYFKNGNDIYISKPDDVEDFAKNIDNIFNDYTEAIKVGLNGKLTCENKFNYIIESKKILVYIENNNGKN